MTRITSLAFVFLSAAGFTLFGQQPKKVREVFFRPGCTPELDFVAGVKLKVQISKKHITKIEEIQLEEIPSGQYRDPAPGELEKNQPVSCYLNNLSKVRVPLSDGSHLLKLTLMNGKIVIWKLD